MEITEDFLIRDEKARSEYPEEEREIHHRRVMTLGAAKAVLRAYGAGIANEIPPWWRLLVAGLLETAGEWVLALMGRVRATIKLFLLSRIGELEAAALKAAEFFGIETGGGVMAFLRGKLVPKADKVAAVAVPLAFQIAHWRRLSVRIEFIRSEMVKLAVSKALKQNNSARRYRRKVKSRA